MKKSQIIPIVRLFVNDLYPILLMIGLLLVVWFFPNLIATLLVIDNITSWYTVGFWGLCIQLILQWLIYFVSYELLYNKLFPGFPAFISPGIERIAHRVLSPIIMKDYRSYFRIGEDDSKWDEHEEQYVWIVKPTGVLFSTFFGCSYFFIDLLLYIFAGKYICKNEK